MHDRTGHVAEAFHVGPKVLWMRRHAPEVYAAAELFLQPRDVVLHALTGVIATDETHANSTVFFDLVRRDWALDLLEAFDLEPALFPPVHPPWAVVGEINAGIDGLDGSPVVIGSADSQCAQYGNGVLEPGPVSEMSGASSCLNTVVLAPLRDERVTHYSFLVPGCYSTELGVNTTGAALRWVVDQLGFADFAELEAAAERGRLTIRAAAGDPRQLAPLFLPYLGDGERTDAALRSAFIGLSDRHSRAELAYAALEGVAFAVIDTIDVLRHAGSAVDELVTSGGAARLATLGAIKADALDRPVRHLAHDSARVGIALFAAAQVGYGAQATAALAANTSSALVHEPDPALREAVAARHAWFREVRASPTVRVGA
jgi:sugar (pentulose or hexulose) kinase